MEKLWNRNFVKAMCGNFATFFAFYLLTPLLPLYLNETFGATKDTIGVVLSGYVIAALVVRPFSGYIVDNFSRYKVLLLCFFCFSVCFAGYLAASSLLLFMLVRTLHGAPFGAITVANSTVAIDVLPSSRRNEGIGYYGLSNNVAMAIAPSVAIWIHNMTQSFSVLFATALAIALTGLLVVSGIKLPPCEPKKKASGRLSLDRFFLTRAWLLALNIVFFGLCFGVLSNYLAIYSKEVLGITGGTGTFFALLAAGLVSSRLVGMRALREGRLTRNAASGVVFSLLGYVIFVALQNKLGYCLSAFLIGFGNGHLYPAFLNMFIAVAHHNERGTANSSILTAWDVGVGIGIFLGGLLAETWGYTAAFSIVAAIDFAGAVCYFGWSRKFFLARRLDDSAK